MEENQEISISTIIDIVEKRLVIIILSALICGALGFLITAYTYVPMYTSTLMLYVDPRNDQQQATTSSADLTAYNYAKQVVNTYIEILNTNSFMSTLAENCGYDYTAEQMSKNIVTFSAITNTEMIKVDVVTDNPQKSLEIATLISEKAPEKIIEVMSVNDVKVADPPVYSDKPSASNKLRNSAIGVLLGIVASLGLSIAYELFDVRVKGGEELTNKTGIAVLGEILDFTTEEQKKQAKKNIKDKKDAIVRIDDTVEAFQKNFNVVEAYNALRINLLFAVPKKGTKKIVVTSSDAGEGKTTTTVNMAVTIAQAGLDVLLIDADLRKPRVHKLLKLRNKSGFSNVISSMTEIGEVIQPTPYEHLSVITAGMLPPNPNELLSSDRVKEILDLFDGQYEYILIDTPPVNVVSDCLPVSAICDGTIIVVKHMFTTYPSATDSVNSLKFVNANIVGMIINCIDPTSSSKRYTKYGKYKKYGKRYYKYGKYKGYGYDSYGGYGSTK